MPDQLAAIVEEFELARARVTRLASATSEERWVRRREPERWSVGECIAHLNLTSRAYLPLLRAAYEQHLRHEAHSGRYRRDFVGRLLGAFVGPMPRIGTFQLGRAKTIAVFVPSGDLGRDETVADFNALQDEQIALTKDARGRPLDEMRIVSPFNPRITYNGYSCLVLLPRHQMRHILQAEQVWSEARGSR